MGLQKKELLEGDKETLLELFFVLFFLEFCGFLNIRSRCYDFTKKNSSWTFGVQRKLSSNHCRR